MTKHQQPNAQPASEPTPDTWKLTPPAERFREWMEDKHPAHDWPQPTTGIAAMAEHYFASQPPASEPDYACKVCGNAHDETGTLEHGRGCYTQDEDGGGSEYIEEADKSRHPAEPSGRHVPSVKDIDDVYTEELSEEAIADLEKLRQPATPAGEREEAETLNEERLRILKIKRATCQGCLAAAMGKPLHTVADSGYPSRSYCGDAWEQGWEFINGSAEWHANLAALEASHTALQAKLDAVAGLVEKWREAAEMLSNTIVKDVLRQCADELAAALAGGGK
jgi:hypothetical protein